MKIKDIINESGHFVGTCVNSFDEDGECIIDDLYRDTSDFAVHEEESTEISEEEFKNAIGVLPPTLDKEISNDRIYLYDEDNEVYMIYDDASDVHYFFKS